MNLPGRFLVLKALAIREMSGSTLLLFPHQFLASAPREDGGCNVVLSCPLLNKPVTRYLDISQYDLLAALEGGTPPEPARA